MLGALCQLMIPALALALERDGTKRDQPVMEDQHDIRPLMTNDKSLAMIERLGVFWMQTGTMLERTIHDNRNIPGQLLQLLPGLGNVLGLFLGEALQRIDCDLAVGFQHLRELRFVQSGKPGGFFEGMFRGHDHQKQQITGADPLKTSTDPDTPRNPSLQGASLHGASSL